MIKRLLARLITWALPAPAAAPEVPERPQRIHQNIMAKSARAALPAEIEPYEPPDGVIPATMKAAALGMDSTPYDYVNSNYISLARFRGYPYLAMLSQIAEYRKMSETIAKYMTKKFIKVTSSGEGKQERIDKMQDALTKFKVQDVMRRCAEMDGFFGRGQIYIDVQMPNSKAAARDDLPELLTPLLRTSNKIGKGGLIGLTNVDPMWTYPAAYNSTDPLRPDYYRPSSWFVMSKTIHASRLLMMTSREVPDLLKASYNFGGLSLSQLAEPVINNWLRTRDSISDVIHSFSLSGMATNLSSELAGNASGDSMFDRADLFNNLRDNRGLLLIDKDTEEFFQFNTPLSGLAELQSQAQEMPAAVANIPLVFLLGITPNGMNATSEGEIEVFFSYIATMQHTLFDEPLKAIFDIIQLSEFGDIDPTIGFEYHELTEMDLEQAANIEKTKADTDAVLIDKGVIAPQESRDRLIHDERNAYHGLEGSAPEIEEEGPEDAPSAD